MQIPKLQPVHIGMLPAVRFALNWLSFVWNNEFKTNFRKQGRIFSGQ
jgi:hypothetical protein